MSPDAAFVRPGPDWLPRLMVIDGCNVGRSSCGLTREAVSCAGLLSVIRWLLLRDFDCVVFLPVVYNNALNANTTHVHLLPKLEEAGLVTFTPARASNGGRRAFINYDDLYVTTLAERHGGCVLSGDRFKDILAQSQYSNFHDLIRNRVLDVKFLFLPHEVVHFGDDIFYKAAPELHIQEDLSTRAKTISTKIHASPDDPNFSRVATRRLSFTHARRQHLIRMVDDLLFELCEREAIRPMRLESLPSLQPRARMSSASNYVPEQGAGAFSLVRDDCVWQPGDSVTMAYPSRMASAVTEPLRQPKPPPPPRQPVVEELLIDFSEDAPNPVSEPRPPPPVSLDPFDLLDLQLGMAASPAYPCPPGDACPVLTHAQSVIEEETDEIVRLVEHSLTVGRSQQERHRAGRSRFFPVPESPLPPQSSLGSMSPAGLPTEDDIVRADIARTLCDVFPRDVVQMVMTANASLNVDFLAEQCLLMSLA